MTSSLLLVDGGVVPVVVAEIRLTEMLDEPSGRRMNWRDTLLLLVMLTYTYKQNMPQNQHTYMYNYRIAGNFRMVETFVYFVLKSIIRKLKLMKISLQYCQYVLRHYAELYEYLNYEH